MAKYVVRPQSDGAVELIGKLACLRCHHQWWPRSSERPVICPRCKSAYWDRPRKAAEAAEAVGGKK